LKNYQQKQSWKVFLAFFAFIIVVFSFWYLNTLSQKISAEESKRVRLWVETTRKKAALVKATNELFVKIKTEERKKNISKSLIGLKWSNERKLNVSINRSKQKHPRWKPLSKENQDFIRKYYLIESHNWIRNNMPQKITQKKLHKCITNLVNNPHMEVITDFI
jgi:hypothetical protein